MAVILDTVPMMLLGVTLFKILTIMDLASLRFTSFAHLLLDNLVIYQFLLLLEGITIDIL